MIRIRVDGTPKPQPRPRTWMDGEDYKTVNPDSAALKAWKQRLTVALVKRCPKTPWAGPVYCAVDFLMRRPKRAKLPPGECWHSVACDRDNLEKAVLDVATKVGFWGDDRQVVAGPIRKLYAAADDEPGARIILAQIVAICEPGPMEHWA